MGHPGGQYNLNINSASHFVSRAEESTCTTAHHHERKATFPGCDQAGKVELRRSRRQEKTSR
jgi:hypothetical protein